MSARIRHAYKRRAETLRLHQGRRQAIVDQVTRAMFPQPRLFNPQAIVDQSLKILESNLTQASSWYLAGVTDWRATWGAVDDVDSVMSTVSR